MDRGPMPAPLTGRELEALMNAAAGYAREHADAIAARAHDRSPHAAAQRVRYSSLLSALGKLGVELQDPLPPRAQPAPPTNDLAEIIRRAA